MKKLTINYAETEPSDWVYIVKRYYNGSGVDEKVYPNIESLGSCFERLSYRKEEIGGNVCFIPSFCQNVIDLKEEDQTHVGYEITEVHIHPKPFKFQPKKGQGNDI
jgi:hypothetical protein